MNIFASRTSMIKETYKRSRRMDEKMIRETLKKVGPYKDICKRDNNYEYTQRLEKYINTLDNNKIKFLRRACNNQKKFLEKSIIDIQRNLHDKGINNIFIELTKDIFNNEINKYRDSAEYFVVLSCLKTAIKRVQEKRLVAKRVNLEKKEENRKKQLRDFIEQKSAEKWGFENYIESTAIEAEKIVELPPCPIKCDKSPLKKRSNKNKLLDMSTG